MSADVPGRRVPRFVFWLVSVAVGLVAVCAGGGVGALTADLTRTADGPTAPPELPEAFPGADQRYLPQLTVATVRDWITDNDYECEPFDPGTQSEPDPPEHITWCRSPGGVDASVDIEYDEESQVRLVVGECRRTANTAEDYCERLFKFLADTVFLNQPDVREEAMTWAAENYDNDVTTVLGGIELQFDLENHRLSLRPAG